MARAPTDVIATTASPFNFTFCPALSKNIAHTTVIAITKGVLFVKFNTEAIAIAPNAMWDKPSPIKENLFKTNVTPKRAEQREISTPTISAYLTKGY